MGTGSLQRSLACILKTAVRDRCLDTYWFKIKDKKEFGLKNKKANHHTVVSGDVSPTIGLDRNAIWRPPGVVQISRWTLRGSLFWAGLQVLGQPGQMGRVARDRLPE